MLNSPDLVGLFALVKHDDNNFKYEASFYESIIYSNII